MRSDNWETNLSEYLACCRETPFEWGAMDCGLFCAGAIIAMTGIDLAADMRGRYSTEFGAAKALHQYGGLSGYMDKVAPRVDPAFAKRGDVVMREGSLGLCLGTKAVFVGQDEGREGLLSYPMSECEGAWSIG